jgi:primosomal protein N''
MFLIAVAVKCFVGSSYASTQSSTLDTEIKNLANAVVEENGSPDSLSVRIESTGQLMTMLDALFQSEEIQGGHKRQLDLLKDNILDLQTFLNEAISGTSVRGPDYEQMRWRCELIQTIIREDIRHDAFKHKLKALIDYMQEQLSQSDESIPTREPIEFKRLMLDLIAYGNSEDRTDAEKKEFDLYMSIIGPHSRSITHTSMQESAQ